MKSAPARFEGFSADIFKFLGDLEKEKNNNTKWFAANRDRYDNALVNPAKSFVSAMGQFFGHLNPAIRTEPKFNKTLMRLNKDMRFAKGMPYRNYFLIHFGRFKMDSEFYVYFDKEGIDYGMFLNNTAGEELYFNQNLARYEKDIINIFKKYGLNNKFMLRTFGKEITSVRNRFNADKYFDEFRELKYILLEKELPKERKIIYKTDFVTSAVKTFSNLYPLYCFAISPEPLRLLEEFEERMGMAF